MRTPLTYSSFVAVGTLKQYGDNSASRSTRLYSSGTDHVRTEIDRPVGTSVRILNAGAAWLLRPDGSSKKGAIENSMAQRVDHIPALSLLAEYASTPTTKTRIPGNRPNAE